MTAPLHGGSRILKTRCGDAPPQHVESTGSSTLEKNLESRYYFLEHGNWAASPWMEYRQRLGKQEAINERQSSSPFCKKKGYLGWTFGSMHTSLKQHIKTHRVRAVATVK
jgi:hypothetical protein